MDTIPLHKHEWFSQARLVPCLYVCMVSKALHSILSIPFNTELGTRFDTVNSEIFARVLFSRNSASAKFRENKTLAKWRTVVGHLTIILLDSVAVKTGEVARITYATRTKSNFMTTLTDFLPFAKIVLCLLACLSNLIP